MSHNGFYRRFNNASDEWILDPSSQSEITIELYLDIPDTVQPNLILEFNGETVDTPISETPNEHGHYAWIFTVTPKQENIIRLHATGLGSIMDKSKYVSVVEVIADNVNFDIVHQMNCNAQPKGLEYQKGATQLDSAGYIEIPIGAPVWKYWCDTLDQFKYEDYPNWQ